MLSKLFLILAGMFAGMWLRDTGSTALASVGVPLLALLALLLAVTTTPRTVDQRAAAPREEAYRRWLDAWHRARTSTARERATVEAELTSAGHAILLNGSDAVVRSLRFANQHEFGLPTVARLVMDMRRSVGSAGVTLRAADLEVLLATRSGPDTSRAASSSQTSFLT